MILFGVMIHSHCLQLTVDRRRVTLRAQTTCLHPSAVSVLVLSPSFVLPVVSPRLFGLRATVHFIVPSFGLCILSIPLPFLQSLQQSLLCSYVCAPALFLFLGPSLHLSTLIAPLDSFPHSSTRNFYICRSPLFTPRSFHPFASSLIRQSQVISPRLDDWIWARLRREPL